MTAFGWLLLSGLPAVASAISAEAPPAVSDALLSGDASQDAAPALAEPSPRSDEDVVVTADVQAKVAEVGPLGTLPILTTPYSINSVPADTIELRQTRTLIELQKTDPSAQFLFDGFGAPVVAIRGFPADVRLNGTRTQISTQFPLEFVDRIDLVKGAAGFLYGFVAPGGIVDYQLKRPTDHAFVNVAASYRSDSDVLARADVNQPITGTLGVRVNALYERGETYLDDDRQNRVAASIAADWHPTDALRLQADFTYQRNAPRSGGGTTVLPFPGVALPSPLDPRTRYLQKWERFRVGIYSYGVRGDWRFAPDWTLSLRARGFTQPRTYYSSGGLSLEAGGVLTNSIYAFNDEGHDYQQQAIVNGSVATGPLTHHLTVSADRQYDPRSAGNGFNFTAVGPFTVDDPIDVPRPAGFALPDDPLYRADRTVQYAGTVADRVEWGPWTALVALRYVDFSQRSFDPAGTATSRYGARRLTPTIGLLRTVAADVSLYASYAQSLEQGATPPVSPADPVPAPLSPIGSDQFEVGAKARLFGKVTATAAVFHLRRDYQGFSFLADGVTPGFIDDGRQVHTGGELTLSGQVAPGWNVIAGATYLDARIRRATGFAINGDRPVGVAKFQSTLFVEHELARGLFVNGSVFHASKREIETPNDRTIGGFTTVDGGVRLVRDVGGRPVSINANVENILGERYWGGVYFGFLSLGVPRQFKLTISTGF